LAEEPDVYLRALSLGLRNARARHYFFSANPANRQLQKMVGRRLRLVENRILCSLFHRLLPLIQKTEFFVDLPAQERQYRIYAKGENGFAFTAAEEELGRRELARMGLGENDWFICVHARDSAYLRNVAGKANTGLELRDCNIENFKSAIDYIIAMGGFVIRMGAVVEGPLGGDSPQIIDYATHFRSDFLDIYLPSKCRFFLGSNSGYTSVPMLFDKPTGWSNMTPLTFAITGRNNIWLPKYFRRITDGVLLGFDELRQIGLFEYENRQLVFTTDEYSRKGVDCVENEPLDLLDLCRDLYDMIKNRALTEAERELQLAFHREYIQLSEDWELAAPVGIRFLLRRRNLLSESLRAQVERALADPAVAKKISSNPD
jgi:putative glycosyltransferase (TIGR04372 family)